MRYILAALLLLAVSPAAAQTTRYPVYREPLWRFTYYPNGIPKAGERKAGFSYWPYASPYRTDYPRDSYNRNRSARYPVR